MLYYEKDDVICYKLDPDLFTYTEVFNVLLQKRIMKITNQAMYEDVLSRILNGSFKPCTEEKFKQFLDEAKASIY